MKLLFLFLFISVFTTPIFCQASEDPKNNKDIPLYIVDSIVTPKQTVEAIKPSDIANIYVKKGSDALKIRQNKEKKNTVVFVETKKFAQKRVWNFLKSKSEEYGKIVPAPGQDQFVQYVINGRPTNSEGQLSIIDDDIFLSIDIVPKDTLLKRYGIYRKKYGVIIETK